MYQAKSGVISSSGGGGWGGGGCPKIKVAPERPETQFGFGIFETR